MFKNEASMELDELKIAFQKIDQQAPVVDAQHLDKMMRQKTHGPTDRIRKNLLWELLFCVLFLVGIVYLGFYAQQRWFRIYCLVFVPVILVFTGVLIWLYQRIAYLQANADLPVRENTGKIRLLITAYCKNYMRFLIVLMPACAVLSVTLALMDPSAHHVDTHINTWIKVKSPVLMVSILIAYFTVLFAGGYYFTKWYLKKLYGQHLIKLEKVLEELN
jgi:hypothetical protein